MTHPVHTQALRAQCRIDTPLGPMRLAASAHGLAGAWFEDQRHHPGPLAAPEDGEHPWLRAAAAALAAYWRGEWPECVDPVSDQVGDGSANAAGKAMAREIGNEVGHRFGPKADGRPRRERVGAEPLDAASRAVSLDLAGTAFQQTVWKALRCIPPGATLDYASLAAQLGRPGAARAVGAAVGRNPVSLLLPCHRVVGRDGRLTGYAGGLARKQALLAHEAHEAQETHASAGVNSAMKASSARQAGATPSLPLADAPQRMNEPHLMAVPAARQAVR